MSIVKSPETCLKILPEKCTGCNMCVYACALKHTADTDPAGSRITIIPTDQEKKSYVPINCLHCDEPDCVEVCPTGALVKNGQGMVSIDDERCVGCLACTLACPYGGARFDAQANMSMICDYCDGIPECVRFCPEGALEFDGAESIISQLEESRDLWSKGISCCPGCSTELALRFILRILGKNTILYVPPSCAAAAIAGWGETPNMEIPNMLGFLTNSASILTGVRRHYQRLGRELNVVTFAGDGGTADVGFQSLSGAAERNENMIYICNDNEGYMNTGIQRSGTTPYGAWTTTTPVGEVGKGKRERGKEMPWIMLAHGVPYVAVTSIGFPGDLELKLRKAMKTKGFSYIHIHTPCPTGWRFPPEKTLEVARMAVKTHDVALWEAEDGRLSLTVKIRKPVPIGEYTKSIGKYSHLSSEQLLELQSQVERRYKRVLTAASVDRYF